MLHNSFFVWVSYAALLVQQTSAFSVERKRLAGIWKLEPDKTSSRENSPIKSSILLRIQEDGSFRQCDEETDISLEGCWDFEDGQLQLAIGRRCLPTSADTLLSGKIVIGNGDLTLLDGVISSGRFMYPQGHAAFFDSVMAAADAVGKFSLKQVMGFHKMMAPSKEDTSTTAAEEEVGKFSASDLVDRQFVMTVVPIESKIKPPKEWDKQKRTWYNPLDDLAADIRTLPIQFFANATFTAVGVNKILRGRYEISKKGKLWFQVSRFGMGRSVPGSVYSEGIGLSHEDERTYVGRIEEQKSKGSGNDKLSLRIEGKVTFGKDLGSDARPEPVGTFILHELGSDEPAESNEDSDIFDSVFE